MRAHLNGLTRRYGQELLLIPRAPLEVRTLRAFLQPIRKNREELPVTATPLGAVNEQRWLYIGPADRAMERETRLCCGGVFYRVQESVTVPFGEEDLYCRAVLVRAKEMVV